MEYSAAAAIRFRLMSTYYLHYLSAQLFKPTRSKHHGRRRYLKGTTQGVRPQGDVIPSTMSYNHC